ncbi:MAG: GNAT family N-acetyltransferase [Candidatus Saliniplasma sp.]
MTELKGETTVLKTLEREDCKKLWREHEVDQELPTQQIEPGRSIEQAEDWFEDIQKKQGDEQYYLGIFTKDDRLVGDIQLSNIDWRNRTAQLGIGISKKEDRNKGYGSDACLTILKFAFDHLDLYRIAAKTYEYNKAAIKLLKKNNFTLEGREREAVSISGERYDRFVYGLLRDEFRD